MCDETTVSIRRKDITIIIVVIIFFFSCENQRKETFARVLELLFACREGFKFDILCHWACVCQETFFRMWKHRLLYWWKRTYRYTLGPPPCICSSSRVTRLTITIIILSNELVQLRIYYLGQGAFQPRKADDTEGTRLAKLSRSGSQSKHRIRFTLPARGTSDII